MKIIPNRSIFHCDFEQNVNKRCIWRGKSEPYTFILTIQCQLALQKNKQQQPEKREHKSNDTKSRFIYSSNGIVVKSGSSVHHHHHNIVVVPHKSETKWIYWPLFSFDIDMISLKIEKCFDVFRMSIINQSIESIVRHKRG